MYLILSNGEVLTLDENVITDNELLLKKEIDTTLYNKLKSDNDIISLCNMAIKYINIRLRSIKEVRDYFQGKTTKNEMIEKIKQESRRYAKRQLTWFRKNKQTIWLDSLEKIEDNINIILEEANIER